MNKKNKYTFLLALFLVVAGNVFAAKRYWLNNAAANWNTTANWSATSGGTSGASVPGSSDTAYFDTNGKGDCRLDANVDVKRLEMVSGYDSTITQNGYTITVGTGGAVLSGGTFTGSSSAITFNGIFTVSGAAFTSTSGTLTCVGNFTLSSGSFSHNNGTALFTATSTITGNITFYTLKLDATTSNRTLTVASGNTLTVNADFYLTGDHALTVNTGTIEPKADIYLSNTAVGGGGSATVLLNGTGTDTIFGSSTVGNSALPKMTINKASGTLFFANNVSLGGNYNHTAGTLSVGTSTLAICATATVTADDTLHGFTLAPTSAATVTIASGHTVTVNGTFATSGTVALTVNTGAIYAKGDLSIGNTNTSTGGSSTITINGTGTQILTGNSTVGGGPLPNVTINKTSTDTVKLSGIVSVKGNWTRTAGKVSAGTSTVVFTSSNTITGSQTLKNVTFPGTVVSTVTISSGTTITVDSTLSILGTNLLIVSTGTIAAKGDITVTNTSTVTTAGGTATILINGTGTQTLTGSGVANTGYLPVININKSSGTLYLASQISSRRDWIYTAGTVDAQTYSSVVWFNGAFDLDGQGTSGTMIFRKAFFAGSSVRTLTGNLNVHDRLTINAGSTLASSGYSITLSGDWINNGTWTPGGSAVTIDGSGYQSIEKASSALETFTNLTVNKSGGSLTLNTPIKITTALTLTKGKIKPSSTNYLEFADNATVSGGSDSGYVHGPLTKTGDDAFIFPLGDTTLSTGAYHPLGITAPASSADKYTGTYFPTGQTAGSTLVDSLESISSCEYWTLAKSTGTPSVTVTLNWNSNVCESNYTDFTVAAWDGSQWADRGASSISSSGVTGSVTSSGAVNLTSPIKLTFGTKKPTGPYVLLHKQMDGGFYTIGSAKSLFFKFDDEYANANHTLNIKIWNESHTDVYPSLINHTHTSLYGDMRFKVDLFSSGLALLASGNYLMEVTNEKNEKQYLKFKIQ